MSAEPTDDVDSIPELEIIPDSVAEFIGLPDGGSFVFPQGASWFAEVLDCAAARVWGNGDISILPNPAEDQQGMPKWRRIKHSPLAEVPK